VTCEVLLSGDHTRDLIALTAPYSRQELADLTSARDASEVLIARLDEANRALGKYTKANNRPNK
jgi:hypothetical protein